MKTRHQHFYSWQKNEMSANSQCAHAVWLHFIDAVPSQQKEIGAHSAIALILFDICLALSFSPSTQPTDFRVPVHITCKNSFEIYER